MTACLWKDITNTPIATVCSNIDDYFLHLCKAQDIYNYLSKKYNGKYGLSWSIVHLDGCDIRIDVTSFSPDIEFSHRIYFDEKTGRLKTFLEKIQEKVNN